MDRVNVRMSFQQVARAGAALALLTVCLSCGDTFRPVAIPVTQPPPDPSTFHYVVSLSVNGVTCNPSTPSSDSFCDRGASTRIDVSGDSNVGVAKLGPGPVHGMVTPNGAKIYVANSLEDSLSSYSPSDATTVATVGLPAGSVPVFVHSTQNDTVYVANAGNNTVSAVATATNAVTSTIPVGSNPIALAETPDATKLYVVNQGDGTVTAVNVSDKTVSRTIPVGASPVWAIARTDSKKVYVLNSGAGTISTIEPFTDTLSSTVSLGTGAGANFMRYDKTLNRLYVTNPGASTLTIVDVSGDTPVVLISVPVPAAPVSVALLPNGTRAYVASYQINGSTQSSQVTVIDTQTFAVRKTISFDDVTVSSLPTGCDTARFRVSIAAPSVSGRVYVSNCDAGYTAIIRTTDDTVIMNTLVTPPTQLTITAPYSSFTPSPVGAVPPPQNPVFILAGP
ncbi:MAG: YncE family protein [Acidobacteria bacterium]|nr:YncE family protein [Acidobacteriota bacterium]